MPAKPSFEEYDAWLSDTHGLSLANPRYKTYYELNATRALDTVQQHQFFTALDNFLLKVEAEYDAAKAFGLFMGKNEIKLLKKPYDSVVNKSYRKNIVFNRRFPAAPNEGWCLPDTWFDRLDDLIRGTVVTKYIDAPEFLSNKLSDFASGHRLTSTTSSRESDSGYYAYHFYLDIPIEIAQVDMHPRIVNLKVEIQITTQLQEVLRKLTHIFYEELRLNPVQDKRAWKWDVNSPRFQASYLGHTLHLLEGVIVQLKNRPTEGINQAGLLDEGLGDE